MGIPMRPNPLAHWCGIAIAAMYRQTYTLQGLDFWVQHYSIKSLDPSVVTCSAWSNMRMALARQRHTRS